MAKSRLKIKIEGADDVLRAFDRFDKASRENLRSTVRKNANALRKAIKNRAPVDSGNLRDSIAAKYDKDGLGADVGPTKP
ncbi:HK97 gp10 family phage protein, partial [Myxococcus sp. CA039A]|nr:HK97 gp10 family phage protein [Myxococcus sp. CA039A]